MQAPVLQRLLYSLLLAFSLPVSADELSSFDLPSQVSVEWLSGNDGRDDVFLDVDLSIGGPRLLFSLAQSRVDSEFSQYSTRSYLVGFYNDPLQTWNYGAELQTWGLENNLRSVTARGFLAYNSRDWTLALRPQLRDIRLITSDFCRRFPECPDEWRIKSAGLSVSGNYYLGAWGFALRASAHNYDRDLRLLALSSFMIRLFTPLALELATGFEDYGVSLGLRYAFRRGLLSVDEYRSVSAVDGLASWLTSARVSVSLNPQWQLRFNSGLLRMPALGGDNTLYAGLGAVYSW